MRNIQQNKSRMGTLYTTVLGPEVHRLFSIDPLYNLMALGTNEFLFRFVWAAGRRILPGILGLLWEAQEALPLVQNNEDITLLTRVGYEVGFMSYECI